MKVKLLTSRVCHDREGRDAVQLFGQEVEIDRPEALRMIAAGQAESLPGSEEEATNEPRREAAVSRKSPSKTTRKRKSR